MIPVLDRLVSRRRAGRPDDAKAVRPGSFIALDIAGDPVWTPHEYAALAEEGYARNAIVHRCVRLIAENAASIPWTLHRGREEITDHPLLDLLERPNPMQGGRTFMESWYGFLQVSGNAFMEIVETPGDRRELHVLRPDRVKVVPDSRGWPVAWDYTASGRTTRLRRGNGPGPVLHQRLFHPADDHYGMSPLRAAAYGVDIHNAAGAWNKALLDNAARPSGALIYKGPDGETRLTERQYSRLRRELEDSYQGAMNAGRPMLLEGCLEWMSMGLSPKDMDFIGAKNVAAREIALAFGVSPMLLGIPGDNTYSNYAEANRSFWRQTVLPLMGRTANALTTWLTPRFGDGLMIRFDANRIESLAMERESLWERIRKADFLTLNEKRAAAGYGAIPGGDRPPGAADGERT